MDKVQVRLKMTPGEVTEVAPDEVEVLRRQGLLAEDEAAPAAPGPDETPEAPVSPAVPGEAAEPAGEDDSE